MIKAEERQQGTHNPAALYISGRTSKKLPEKPVHLRRCVDVGSGNCQDSERVLNYASCAVAVRVDVDNVIITQRVRIHH